MRSQRCSINGTLSKPQLLRCGIPQGTILGPLLFLLYINDLPNCLSKSQPRLYADDTHLTYVGVDPADIESNLNHDLANITDWLIANKLTLNATKTEFMLIGTRQKISNLDHHPKPEINGTPIDEVTCAKSLGVLIDSNLTWRDHVDKITKKIASGIGAIKRVRHLVPQATLHNIYNALVQPHFDYCNVVWGNCGVTLHNKLQKLQNRAARVLTHSAFDANANLLFDELGWVNLDLQQRRARAIMTFKCRQGLAPDYLSTLFSNHVCGYDLRDSAEKLNVPLPRTEYYKKSFSYSGAVTWNSLPVHMRQAQTLQQFKNLTKDLI